MNGGQRSAAAGTNLNSYDFDFGLPSSRSASSQPLRPNPSPSPARAPSWSHQPASGPAARPSWAHQPPSKPTSNPVAGPTSMVGDIFGKSWTSSTPSGASSIGIPQNNANLFGDLFASALGSGSGRGSNTPLKSMAPPPKSSFSMNNLSDSLPKSTISGSDFAAFSQPRGNSPMGPTGQPMRSAAGSFGSAPTMGQRKDPFDSLAGFGSNPKSAMKPTPAPANSAKLDGFGSTNPTQFDAFPMPPQAQTFSSSSSSSSSTTNRSSPLPNNDMDMFFTSKTTAKPPPPTNELNDWDIGSDFAAADAGGTTTELEGLPPPPAGLTGSAAKAKGMDNYKQGQYADAIKWLSWAFTILDKQGDQDAVIEVLTCRASSYKEVGEYKKAIADCSKVLEHDKENVSVLIQRALLYESNEKYRLGAEDLRMVLKIDPGNRLARSTIHRLQKMAN